MTLRGRFLMRPHRPRAVTSRLQPWLDLRAALYAGLIAGTLFCALELLMRALVLGESIWSPLRMIGGILLGRDFAEGNSGGGPLGVFDIALALALHLTLSTLYAIIGCLAFHRLAHGPAMLLGIMLGFTLYIINYFFFSAIFDWFQAAQGLWPLVLHVLFGLTVALSYHLLRTGHWRLVAARAGPGETHAHIGRLPIDINWNAALWAALISATIFLILEMTMTPLLKGASPWRPLHMIAGIALGADSVPSPEEPAPFSLHVLAAALLVHFTLSMIYSTVGSIVFRWLTLRWAIATGLALGLLLYAINFYGFAQQFEWFKQARGWQAIVVHLIYGLAAAVTHKWRE